MRQEMVVVEFANARHLLHRVLDYQPGHFAMPLLTAETAFASARHH